MIPVIVSDLKGNLGLKCSWRSGIVVVDSNGIHVLPEPLPIGRLYTITISRQPENSYCTVRNGSKMENREDADTVTVTCRDRKIGDFAPLKVGKSWVYKASYDYTHGPVASTTTSYVHWKRQYQIESVTTDIEDTVYSVGYQDFDLVGNPAYLGLAIEKRRFECRESKGRISCEDPLYVCMGGIPPSCMEVHPFFATRRIDTDSLRDASVTECEQEFINAGGYVYMSSVGLIRALVNSSWGSAGHIFRGTHLYQLMETDGQAFSQGEKAGTPCGYLGR